MSFARPPTAGPSNLRRSTRATTSSTGHGSIPLPRATSSTTAAGPTVTAGVKRRTRSTSVDPEKGVSPLSHSFSYSSYVGQNSTQRNGQRLLPIRHISTQRLYKDNFLKLKGRSLRYRTNSLRSKETWTGWRQIEDYFLYPRRKNEQGGKSLRKNLLQKRCVVCVISNPYVYIPTGVQHQNNIYFTTQAHGTRTRTWRSPGKIQ